MDPYYTQTGNRDDLAALPVISPEGFIADRIYPIVPVAEKAGSVAYATVNVDSNAQTGRSAGVAPTNTQVANSATTFSCAEAIKRYSITPDEAKQMGGIEKADEVGAKAAKRSIFRKIESDVCTAILGGVASNNFDPAKIQTDVQIAIDAVEQFGGAISLVTSTKTVKAMVQALLNDSTQGKVMSRIISGTSPSVAATGLNFQAWVDALALYLGIDQVLIGKSEIWNATAVKGRFAIARLDDGTDPLSHKYMPVLGKRFQFLRDGVSPWYVESNANRDTKNNNYDASVWYEVKTLNSGALYLFDGVADA
jgi:hypothetical protein